MILKIFSSIFLLIFILYKNIVDTAVQFHGLLFFNHLNIARILLYHSRLSLARKVQREDNESIWCFNIKLYSHHDSKKTQWVGRPATMIPRYHKTFQISFVLTACKSTMADNGRKDWVCTSDYMMAEGLWNWSWKTSSQSPHPSPALHQLAKLCCGAIEQHPSSK